MSELSTKNFHRVGIINLLMSIPLFGLFSWIGFSLCYALQNNWPISLIAATLCAFPMMLTMLHGHVTMAIGVTHRDKYYHWLNQKTNPWGWFFHPIFISTKFRFSGLAIYTAIILVQFIRTFP
jgi:hypothetical protein